MAKITSINPANYQINAEVNVSSVLDISRKVQQARKAFLSWSKLLVEKRLGYIKKIRENIEINKSKLAKLTTMEMGKPIHEAETSLNSNLRTLDYLLNNSLHLLEDREICRTENQTHTLKSEPLGVVGVIAPWNFPSGNLIFPTVTNLIAGNTVVAKHSELCPLTGQALEKIFNRYLPPGVFNEVYGDGRIGQKLVNEDINFICFTGSSQVGRELYQIAAGKFIQLRLELGGSAPGIVFKDADLDNLDNTIFWEKFHNSSQVCTALKRLIVEESKVDEVLKRLSKILQIQVIGDPLNEKTTFGPLASETQLKRAQVQLHDAISKGAEVVSELPVPSNLEGAYIAPTILTGIKKNMLVWQEEVFAPILPVVTFKNESEAVELANDTRYGLGGYIYTSDPKKAVRIADQIVSGNVSINGATIYNPSDPFGGAKDSGVGRQHGENWLRDLCNTKVVVTKRIS